MDRRSTQRANHQENEIGRAKRGSSLGAARHREQWKTGASFGSPGSFRGSSIGRGFRVERTSSDVVLAQAFQTILAMPFEKA
ncbi:MAG: hypothetical protein AUI33_08260 [Ignavibacteria bacterium 13_1_40CM_2_61_4]|nr:MAG: hypothetical protein AUI33_08260 [Ignavibacteria bacterium 13_1_40CM_2_61_4]